MLMTLAALRSDSKNTHGLVRCVDCHFLQDCGGLDGQQGLWGCFSKCYSDGLCGRADWTCPCRPKQFARRLAEVGGDLHSPATSFLTSTLNEEELPLYIPLIQHGSARRTRFRKSFVALPTFGVVGKHRSDPYGPATRSAAGLRRKFVISESAKVLFIWPTHDQLLELYWAKRRALKTPHALLPLRIAAITLPNFSFFTDAPRTHSLWNRKRLIIAAQELTDAGICTIPHLNTLTRADWVFFSDLLKNNLNVKVVAKEFQTGASAEDVERLSWLQEELKRPIHPLLIGGARFLRQVARYFEDFTLVDSNPFMKTQFRMRLSVHPYNNSQKWTRCPTAKNQPLDSLLEHNVRAYEDWVCAEVSVERPKRPSQLRLGRNVGPYRHRPKRRRKSA
jgi:hypothetical protein